MKKEKKDISFKELELNIKHQNIQVKEFTQIGYEFDDGVYVFTLMIPFKELGFKLRKGLGRLSGY